MKIKRVVFGMLALCTALGCLFAGCTPEEAVNHEETVNPVYGTGEYQKSPQVICGKSKKENLPEKQVFFFATRYYFRFTA